MMENHYLVGVVRCPHLETVGGWLVLLQVDGGQMFSILMATHDGDKRISDSHALVLSDVKTAAAEATKLCGRLVEHIEWVDSMEDGRWVKAANLFSHHMKSAREIGRSKNN